MWEQVKLAMAESARKVCVIRKGSTWKKVMAASDEETKEDI